MTSAEGTKKNAAASTQRLIEEVPLCAAAAIQRGPSTVAMLKNRTSQKPISLRSCLMGSEVPFTELVPAAWKAFELCRFTGSRPARESIHLADENFSETDHSSFRKHSRGRRKRLCLPEEKQRRPLVFSRDACRGSRRWKSYETLASTAGSGHPCARP